MRKYNLTMLLMIILIGAWLSGVFDLSINYTNLKAFMYDILIALLPSTGTLLLHKED